MRGVEEDLFAEALSAVVAGGEKRGDAGVRGVPPGVPPGHAERAGHGIDGEGRHELRAGRLEKVPARLEPAIDAVEALRPVEPQFVVVKNVVVEDERQVEGRFAVGHPEEINVRRAVAGLVRVVVRFDREGEIKVSGGRVGGAEAVVVRVVLI